MLPEGYESEASRESMLLSGGFFIFLWQHSRTKGGKPMNGFWLNPFYFFSKIDAGIDAIFSDLPC
jgi:hypothetical protein